MRTRISYPRTIQQALDSIMSTVVLVATCNEYSISAYCYASFQSTVLDVR